MENVSVNLLLAVLLKTSKATASTVLEDSCLKTDNANKESQTAPVTSLWATWLSVTNANQETVSWTTTASPTRFSAVKNNLAKFAKTVTIPSSKKTTTARYPTARATTNTVAFHANVVFTWLRTESATKSVKDVSDTAEESALTVCNTSDWKEVCAILKAVWKLMEFDAFSVMQVM